MEIRWAAAVQAAVAKGVSTYSLVPLFRLKIIDEGRVRLSKPQFAEVLFTIRNNYPFD
jgi:hypothetical protein